MILDVNAAAIPKGRLLCVVGFPEKMMAPPTMTGKLSTASGERGVPSKAYCTTALVIGSISCSPEKNNSINLRLIYRLVRI